MSMWAGGRAGVRACGRSVEVEHRRLWAVGSGVQNGGHRPDLGGGRAECRGHTEGKTAGKKPLKYFIRHTAFHTLDHAWEMDDKDLTAETPA